MSLRKRSKLTIIGGDIWNWNSELALGLILEQGWFTMKAVLKISTLSTHLNAVSRRSKSCFGNQLDFAQFGAHESYALNKFMKERRIFHELKVVRLTSTNTNSDVFKQFIFQYCNHVEMIQVTGALRTENIFDILRSKKCKFFTEVGKDTTFIYSESQNILAVDQILFQDKLETCYPSFEKEDTKTVTEDIWKAFEIWRERPLGDTNVAKSHGSDMQTGRDVLWGKVNNNIHNCKFETFGIDSDSDFTEYQIHVLVAMLEPLKGILNKQLPIALQY